MIVCIVYIQKEIEVYIYISIKYNFSEFRKLKVISIYIYSI